MVHLKAPDLDVRIAFVEQANRNKRLGLSREQVLTLSSRFEGFRRLEGVLLRIEAFRKHSGRELTETDFQRHIRLSEDRAAPELTPERILEVAANHFGLTVADLTGHSRRKELVFARQAAMTGCRRRILPVTPIPRAWSRTWPKRAMPSKPRSRKPRTSAGFTPRS